MLPLSHWPRAARRHLAGVLTDIDDTLTTEGAITPDALAALGELKRAGLHVIAITGRPVGWSEPFATAWPLDAIVAENGAVALVRDADGRLLKHYQQDAATRARQFGRLQQVAGRIVAAVPGARLARDSAGRETDIAIDHSEFTRLPDERVREVVALMQAEGLTATVSSIHVNGWYGSHDKLAGARWIVRTLLGRDLDEEIDRWAFVGDSTNDACMFERFPHSIGVANIARFADQLVHRPRYVTGAERGAGFAEVARAVLDGRDPSG
ncbi:HAD-IIB family hydrolase [Ramlibacter sp. AW1]|uniref:HAD-IIB family hydrolase n=1 Tax=Ramlibacter aurantiacus TaxID=2801330 RepID=A0A936ZHW0_9BURK|nr:HAD-IIB family hydrolase [Ramlibacter aurantiacus]MBL0421734.1 HAD-IIB family hydrolase [Ramlibacter aurantiacus]